MKVLITGVAGFIGSSLAKLLINKNYTVYGVDNLWKGDIKNIPKGVFFIKGDLNKENTVNEIKKINNIDFICHLAGQSSGEKSFYNPSIDIQLNLETISSVIGLAKYFSVKKIINASSMSVYGDSEQAAHEIKNIESPISIYGLNKLSAEKYLSILAPEIPVINFRMFNVYGPGQCLNDLKQGMVSIYIAMALRDSKILVKGSIDRVRDFIYIDDVINFWEKALNIDFVGHHNLNLGTGKDTTVSELINEIKQIIPKSIVIESSHSTPCDQKKIYADTKKLIEFFGKYKFVYLKEGLVSFINYSYKDL